MSRNTDLRKSEEERQWRSVPATDAAPPDMELVGMRGGNRLYAPMSDVYGAEQGKNPSQPRADFQSSPAAQSVRAQAAPAPPPPKPAMQKGQINQAAVAPATTPAPVYRSALDNPANAFSNAAYARIGAARQTGEDRQAIRAGTASQEVRARNADFVKKVDADTRAWSGTRMGAMRPLDQLVANKSMAPAQPALKIGMSKQKKRPRSWRIGRL